MDTCMTAGSGKGTASQRSGHWADMQGGNGETSSSLQRQTRARERRDRSRADRWTRCRWFTGL